MKTLSITLTVLFCAILLNAQPPQAFKYQAVVRDNAGEIISNQSVGIKISIRDAIPNGTIVYQETFSETTNQFGLVNLEIGNGAPTIGTFNGIDWGSDAKFLEIEIDPAGGTSYVSMGTSELLSVPYALYSDRSADGVWNKNNTDIYYNNGNVGIGKSNPGDKLEISGNGSQSGLRVRYDDSYSTVYGQFKHGLSEGLIINANAGGGGWADIRFQTNGTTKMFLESAGRLGIGTTSPSTNLVVKSSGYTHGMYVLASDDDAIFRIRQMSSGGGGGIYAFDGTGTSTILLNGVGNSWLTSGRLGIGTTNPWAGLHIKGANWPNSFLYLQSEDAGDAGIRLYEGNTTKWHIFNNATDDRLVIYNSDASKTVFIADQTYGNVGIGTTGYLSSKLTVEGNFNAITGKDVINNHMGWVGNEFAAIRGYSPNVVAVKGWTDSGLAGDFHGNVYISGSISKGSGSFLIDHPLDPENKLLRHNFVESPENLLIYRGKTKLNSNGESIVELPDYFEALTMENEATVVLTSIGKPFLTGYEWENDFKAFKIYGESEREVSWVVYADRDDPVIHQLARPVEEEKGPDNPFCEKGKLLYPQAYGYPENTLRDYEEKIKMKEQINKKSIDKND